MKITPVSSPADIKVTAPSVDLKARAVEAFKAGVSSYDKSQAAPTQGQSQETPVANPNQVSAEELSAIRAPAKAIQEAPVQAAEGTEVPAIADNSAKNEPAATAPDKDPAVSRLYAQLARQERNLRAKAQTQELQFKQREAALLAREAEAAQKSELNQKGFVPMDRIKNDPMSVLAEAGVSYDEIAQQIINPVKTDPRTQAAIDALRTEIANLRKATDDGKAEMTKQQQASYNAAVKQIETDARSLVSTDPNFEMIKATGAVKDVVKLITSTYEKDGVLLTVEEAATEIEDYLVEKTMKLAKLNKIQRSQKPQTNNAVPAQKTAQTAATTGQTRPTMKTLTNDTASTRKLTARERAILAFRGESRS